MAEQPPSSLRVVDGGIALALDTASLSFPLPRLPLSPSTTLADSRSLARSLFDADFADRDGGDIFGTQTQPGVKRGKYWDDRLQQWTDVPSPAIMRLMYSEATMPGDVADLASIGMAEGESIWNRMAAIIRARSLDVRILMDAHDRRNYGFVDIPTFRRALCYAFGNQWIDLAMTSAELKEICAPYLSRKPNAAGEPEAFVMWQKFTTDLQALADRKKPTPEFLARLAEVEAREKASAALVEEYGVTEYELKSCLAAIKDRLLTYNASLNAAFRRIDGDSTGYISAAEIKQFFHDAYLGDVVNDRTLAAIIDMSDINGDDEIDYSELSAVIECDDILELAALVPDKKIVAASVKNAKQTVGKYGVTVAVLQKAATTIKDYLNMKYDTVRKALKTVDEDGSGYLTRDEVKAFLVNCYLMKYTDFYTGEQRGEIDEVVIDTLLDFVDKSGDGAVDYNEFTKVIISDDIMSTAPPEASTSIFSYKKGAEPAHRAEGAWGSNAATGFASSL